jgi:hypothetical protein
MEKTEIRSAEASLVKGYVWHVYPDPAASGALAGDSPFGGGDTDGPGRSPLEPPPGMPAFWTVHGKTPDLINQVEDRAYLVLTESPHPPGVAAGWYVEPARLARSFELDQRGGRTVRLIRVVRTAETPSGPLQECEFQVDRG